MTIFNLSVVDPSWHDCITRGLEKMDKTYLTQLAHSDTWLPGHDNIFSAFSMPVSDVNYILFGESPYPRKESANGYAFWDASVKNIWSETGLSKPVNRATSLRNLIKMLLVAEGLLDANNLSQESIAKLDKRQLVQTNPDFFNNFLRHGILLLNATPVLHSSSPQKDARAWYPFTKEVLRCLFERKSNIRLILFGRIAKTIEGMLENDKKKHIFRLCAEHPYNHSFIGNQQVIDFFKPLHLLCKSKS